MNQLHEAQDFILSYKGYHKCDCICRVRLFPREGQTIVIVTELDENHGTSVTNAAEIIATRIVREYGTPGSGPFVWIEHYPERGHVSQRLRETFARVEFTTRTTRRGMRLNLELVKPRWTYMEKAAVEMLIGQPLDEGDESRPNPVQYDQPDVEGGE